jgi:hypothetical protein
MTKLRRTHLTQLEKLSFRLQNVNINEVRHLLSIVDPCSSPGISNVPSRVWKFSAETLAEPLTQLFNYCLEANDIPSEWKFAIVNPQPSEVKVKWMT